VKNLINNEQTVDRRGFTGLIKYLICVNLRNLRTHGGFMSKNKNNKGKQSIQETSSAKKAALLESANKNNFKSYIIITICAIIAAL